METLVSQMTKEELIEIIEAAVERKLLELLADVDEGDLKEAVRTRLLHQKERVAQGERGEAFEDVVRQLDLG